MAWTKGFNFRDVDTFVTDGTDETYVRGAGAGIDAYPTTRNGVTFGYTNSNAGNPQDRDRNAGIDRRLAGVHYAVDVLPVAFQVDLPAPGNYLTRLAAGDYYGARADGFIEIRDSTTPLVTIDHATGFTSGQTFRDLADVEYSAAAWPGSNTPSTLTFSTSTCVVYIGKYATGADGWLAHLFLDQVTGSTAPDGIAGSSGVYSPRGTTQPIASGWA